jgi:glycosyltransferase involved in cell wall biosynthesis
MTARNADALVCDSNAIGRVWRSTFGRDSVFIPYGAPVLEDVGHDRLAEAGISQAPYVLVVARLAPENNVELTLNALDILGDQAPQAVIVGSANFDSPIEHRLRTMQSAGRLKWLGHVDDQELLAELWANSAVYVHGHSVGGTNPALLQALGAGAPTLALDTPFNTEVLPYREHHFPDDARVLAERIQAVSRSQPLQREMANRGREIIRERYSWDDVCRQYMGLLVELAEGRARRP